MTEQLKPRCEVPEIQPKPNATSVAMRTQAPTPVTPSDPFKPNALYFAACGVLCDVFWWARGKEN